jgi:alanyl-tRNA synthetase
MLKKDNSGNIKENLLKSAVMINGIRLIAKQAEMDAEDMKNVSFQLRKENNLAMVLGSKAGGKALLTVMLTDDLIKKGLHAGAMIQEIAKEIQGSGGGQPFFATAGGLNPEGIPSALTKAKEIIEQ